MNIIRCWLAICAVLVLTLDANPIFFHAISEVEVAPADSERVELRHFKNPAYNDTIYNDTFPLINTTIYTPAGSAVVDTDIYLPGMGYAVIDTSVLGGNFSLPDDSGFVSVYGVISSGDSISYPEDVPAPPINHSISLFHTYGVEGTSLYWLIRDWYLDATPTFGTHNDDYPGCSVSGHVYNSGGGPLQDAQVIATAYYDAAWYVVETPPFYKCCTTYSNIDGTYLLDSLLPTTYWVEAYAWPAYYPDTQTTSSLRCLQPLTGFDFYLDQTGISESNSDKNTNPGSIYAFPNPVTNDILNVHIPGHLQQQIRFIDVYDVTGKLCRRFKYDNNAANTSIIQIDCRRLPKGVYFMHLSPLETRLKLLKL